MFKFVVLCAFVASAVSEPEPGAVIASPYVLPYAAYSTVVSPASTSISSHSSSVIHPSPIGYTAPLAFPHFIKKRSAQLFATAYNYNAPFNYYPFNYPATTVVSSAPVVSAPIAYSSAHLPVAAHLIKKRSAPFLPTSYIAPTTYYANPAISTPVISNPFYQTSYIAGAQVPLVNTHYIKKRSAEATPEPAADPQIFYSSASTYLTPSTYTKAFATIPYFGSPVVKTYYSSPAVLPIATHLIKKRSAEPAPEPAAEPAAEPSAEPSADPLLVYSSYPNTYYSGSRFFPTYPAVVKSAPIFATNPFVYSTFIKK